MKPSKTQAFPYLFPSILAVSVTMIAPSGWSQNVVDSNQADAAAADVEPLPRGPVHEAFASPVVAEGQDDFIELPTPPPEPIAEEPAELRPRTSNQEAQWVPGYWGLEGDSGELCWVSGTWRFAPPGRRWLPGYWAENGSGSRWVPGCWIDDSIEQVSYLPEPPPLRDDWQPVGSAPSAQHFWVPGQWVYRSTGYVWKEGFWARSQPDWTWVPACYVPTPRGYFYVSGYWDYRPHYRGILFAPVRIVGNVYSRIYYRPRIAVNVARSLAHFFVRPRYHHYYFGNYYGDYYVNRGFYSWTAYDRYYTASRFTYYDPLYTFFTRNRISDFERYRQRYDESLRNEALRPALRIDDRVVRREIPTDVPDRNRLLQPLEEQIEESRFRVERLDAQATERLQRDNRRLLDFAQQRARGTDDGRLPAIGQRSGAERTLDLRRLRGADGEAGIVQPPRETRREVPRLQDRQPRIGREQSAPGLRSNILPERDRNVIPETRRRPLASPRIESTPRGIRSFDLPRESGGREGILRGNASPRRLGEPSRSLPSRGQRDFSPGLRRASPSFSPRGGRSLGNRGERSFGGFGGFGRRNR